MTGPGSACAWCRGPIPLGKRRDAQTCSKSCRQSRHRFVAAVGVAAAQPDAAGQPRRLAYADPPYPGLSRRYYGGHRDFAGEVDHAELIASLSAEYDAWALSTSARALPSVLRLCPDDVRVAGWFRGGRTNKAARTPVASWEPVLYWGALAVDPSSVDGRRFDAGWEPVDALVAGVSARTTDPERVTGAKPPTFARWVFQLLGATPQDDLVDMFPGSGGIARAWAHFASRSTVVPLDVSHGSARPVA